MRNRLVTLFLMLSAGAYAQQQDSSVNFSLKFLSKEDYSYLTEGNNRSLTLVAEENNYPSPRSVLDLQKQLSLTATQKTQLQTIQTETSRKIKEMGDFLIKEHAKLNKLFETNKINEGSLIYHTNKIGALEGEMRNAYLKAHLRTKNVLTLQQLKKYESLKNTTK